jgi:hypothetical protein
MFRGDLMSASSRLGGSWKNDPSNSVDATALHESGGVRVRTDTKFYSIRTKYSTTVSFSSSVFPYTEDRANTRES